MLSKQCPVCNKKSFSASEKSLWICPYCGADITGSKVQNRDLRGEKMALLNERYDWRQYAERNKGPIMVEKDYNYPGGFYIRHKDAYKYAIAANRYAIENMIENALAALEMNCGCIIVRNVQEIEWLKETHSIAMEILDNQLLDALNNKNIDHAFIKKQFYMDLLWKAIKDIRVNERAPEFKLIVGKQVVTAKDLSECKQ